MQIMNEPRLFKDILKDAMEAQQCTIQKLAELTGVAEIFIKTILLDSSHDVPPLPYARGYILKITKTLELDEKELWDAYLREFTPRGSGLNDIMPKNRFAIERMNIKRLILISIGVIILGYIILISDRLVGAPQLTITKPITRTMVTAIPIIVVQGSVGNNKDIVLINEVAIAVNDAGDFEKKLTLDHGVNTLIIKAKRLLGREVVQTFTVIYEPAPPPPELETPTPPKAKPV